MAEIVKETVTTQTGDSTKPIVRPAVKVKATSTETVEYLIYFMFGVLDILLAFRLILKLMGANPASGFVSFVYSLSSLFVFPFEGIFRRGFTEGIETTSVLEPATAVAIIVYGVLAWGAVKLLRILSGVKEPEE